MKHAVNQELFAYWDRLRAGRVAPERADIDPAAIRSILADTFILEADCAAPTPGYPIRLSGTRFNALFATELKDRPLVSLIAPGDAEAIRTIAKGVLDGRLPALAALRTAPYGYETIDLELLLLPLRHHGKTHARLLGAIAPFHTPSWLGLVAARPFILGPFRFVHPLERPAAAERNSLLLESRRYNHLVVVEGGRGSGHGVSTSA